MAESMVVALQLADFITVQKQLKVIAKQVRGLQGAGAMGQSLANSLRSAVGPAERLARAIERMNRANRGAIGPAPGKAMVPVQAQSPAMAQIAQARIVQAQANAQAAGARAQVAQLRLARAQNAPPRRAPGQPQSAWNAFRIFFRSTRFQVAGASPLVGRSLDALNALPKPIGIAATAIAALGAAAYKASQVMTDFANARLTSGGTMGQQGRLGAIGTMLGQSGMDMSQMARQFADAISNNPEAMAFTGMSDGGIWGPTNKAEKFLRFVNKLMGMTEDQALRATRSIPGMEPLMALRDLPKEIVDQVKESWAMQGSLMSDDAIQRARILQINIAKLATNFMNLTMVIGNLVAKPVGLFINFVNYIMEGWTLLLAWISNGFKMPDAAKSEKKAMDEHTAAMQEHSTALKGGYGRGAGAAAQSVPSNFGAWKFDQYAQAARLGAF